ncbi:MAG: NAD(P)-dependent alcohol dehydrogenase [Ilumatobacteraceae bacterium]
MTEPTMRAITYHAYGGPEVLSVGEVARPQPAEGELSIRVQAAEACKSDTEMRSCTFSASWLSVPMRLVLGVRRPRRHVLGLYFAGVIDAVGPDVEGFEVGDEVYGTTGLRLGSYGEHVVLPAKATIAAKPTSMTFAEAAALPLGASNALNGLRRAGVGAGDRVLVNGAGGVIGAYGVQIARVLGAEVTGVDAAYKEVVRQIDGRHRLRRLPDHRRHHARRPLRRDPRHGAVVTGPRMLDLLQPDGRYVSGNPRLSTMFRATRRRSPTSGSMSQRPGRAGRRSPSWLPWSTPDSWSASSTGSYRWSRPPKHIASSRPNNASVRSSSRSDPTPNSAEPPPRHSRSDGERRSARPSG